MNTFADFKIDLHGGSGIEVTTTCPQCSAKRKNSKAKCLSVNTEKGVWVCHHCDWRGTLKAGEEQTGRKIYTRPVWIESPPSDAVSAWFVARGILPEIITQEGIVRQTAYMPQLEDDVPCIAFPYRKQGVVVNVKYRALQEKAFRQVADAEKVLYRQDAIKKDCVVITEGECFPGDAEVLTPTGWCRVEAYAGQRVVEVDEHGGRFVAPTAYLQKTFHGNLVWHHVKGWNSLTTPGHQLISVDQKKRWRKHAAVKGPVSRADLIPRATQVAGPGIGLSRVALSLCLAVSADATIDLRTTGRRYARFGFKKSRKVDRLRWLLDECGIEASDNAIQHGYQSICFSLPSWVPGRMLPWEWIALATQPEREWLIQELRHWDGNGVPNRNQEEYASKSKANADWVQALCHTTGRCSSIMARTNAFGSWFKVSLLHAKSHSSWQGVKTETVPYDGPVYCLTVPSGGLLVRQHDQITVTGNCDALSVVQAGISSVVSVPDGAPAIASKNYAAKFSYLDQEPDPFDGVEKIVLAVDNDEPGQVLQNELGRRLGTDRCWFVTWPKGCKDANEVLMTHGASALRTCIAQAQPFPVQDVVNVRDLSESIFSRYMKGVPRGLSTSWATVDHHYTVQAGQLTVITGIPGHGKSEWLDALALNLATLHGWRIAVCSPENSPVELHCEKLLEKVVGAPFYPGATERMSPTQVDDGMRWLDEHVTFIMPEDAMTITGVLARAQILVRRLGIQGLVIDPFNEFDHTRPRGQTETEYIGETLSAIKRWARKWQVHVWLVAHPQKLFRREDGTYPVPTPWDINGCYSEDTDVLTSEGWKPHASITIVDLVACFNATAHTFTYQRPTNILAADYAGEMYNFHGYSFDALVTPNHRMLVRQDWRNRKPMKGTGRGRPMKYLDGWTFIEAQHVASELKIPLAAPRDNDAPDIENIHGVDADDALRIAGWYIAEGWPSMNSIAWCQAVGPIQNMMKIVVNRAGLSTYQRITNYRAAEKPMWIVRLYKRQHREFCNWLLDECGSGCATKKMPSLIWALSARQQRIFLGALIDGDGHRTGSGGMAKYATTSLQLVNEVQRLAIELGHPCGWSMQPGAKAHHLTRYQVNIGDQARTDACLSKKWNLDKVPYAGRVYCLTVPTGAYITRRNGKMMIAGNSANFRNKADNCVTVWRNEASEDDPVQVHVQKVRFKNIGRIGVVELKWHRVTGRYRELTVEEMHHE